MSAPQIPRPRNHVRRTRGEGCGLTRADEAAGNIKRAMRLNPQPPFYYLWTLRHAYDLTGRSAEATTTFKTLIEQNPNFVPAHVFLAGPLTDRGLDQQARAEWMAASKLSPQVSLDSLRQMLPYKNEQDLDRLLAAMRKVGLTS